MVINLMTLQQKKDESLRAFMTCFNKESVEVVDLTSLVGSHDPAERTKK